MTTSPRNETSKTPATYFGQQAVGQLPLGHNESGELEPIATISKMEMVRFAGHSDTHAVFAGEPHGVATAVVRNHLPERVLTVITQQRARAGDHAALPLRVNPAAGKLAKIESKELNSV